MQMARIPFVLLLLALFARRDINNRAYPRRALFYTLN